MEKLSTNQTSEAGINPHDLGMPILLNHGQSVTTVTDDPPDGSKGGINQITAFVTNLNPQ